MFQPSRSQHEIDLIANDMTQQIVSELRNGRLTKQQLNQPYVDWRVTSQLSQLDREKEHVRKFYPQLGLEEDRLAARERETIELQRQLHSNIFNPGQVFSHQRQTQHQSGQFQEQTQQQLFTVPRETITNQRQVTHNIQQIHHQQPIQVQYRPAQTIRQENHKHEERIVYNTPLPPVVASQQTSSNQSQKTVVNNRRRLYRPSTPVNNENIHRTEEHRQVETIRQQPALAIIVPNVQSQTVSTNQQTRLESSRQQPILIPSSQSQTVSSSYQQIHKNISRKQPTIVLPTIQTITNHQQARQETIRTNNPAPALPPPPPPQQSSHREYHRSEQHVERIPAVPIVIKPPTYHQRQSTTRTETRSESHPPRIMYAVVPTQSNEHHNTFARLDKYERDDGIVPNYIGRVKLDQSRDVLVEHRQQQQVSFVQFTVFKC